MGKLLIINESQKKMILKESINDYLTDIIKNNYEFVKKVLDISSKQINLNLQFLLTWGASIGGFVGPLNDFIVGNSPEISDVELSLIITGIIAVHFIDNKKTINSIINLIKKNGLFNIFKIGLDKSNELKSIFINFIKSLNITLHKVTNIMSYAFIIPIIPIIYESVYNGVLSPKDGKEIALRLGVFGLLTVSGVVLREIIIKLIRRFSG